VLATCAGQLAEAQATLNGDVRLDLIPKVCTVKSAQAPCEAKILAKWHAAENQSLCLIVLERPEVKRCWEQYSEGSYSIELTFSGDLVFQLRDTQLKDTLASETLRLIREALEYRHRRRAPWNIFEP
jgi:DUF3019 family protein